MNERVSFNGGWRFFPEDIPLTPAGCKGPSYAQAKTEDKLAGPYSEQYPDKPDDFGAAGREITNARWQNVTLPHDYIITQEYDETENNAWGFFHHHPAWYRKHFSLEEADRNKRLVLYFEGVADRCTVYLNGSYMTDSRESHTPFEVDITDFVRFDRENVIAIRVSCGHGEGWWYGGGGIYRPVWLEKSEKLAVERYGVFIAPQKMDKNNWQVPVQVEVRNNGFEDTVATLSTTIYTPKGKAVATLQGEAAVAAREITTHTYTATISNPALWDIDSPQLYTAVTTVTENGEMFHSETTAFGFRTLGFDADKGFFLNGRHVLIQGVCGHGDCGLTGRAVPESLYRYKARMIKEMGANAYRCSHYPQAEYWMDEMDRQGILVMAETRFFTSTQAGIHELRALIRRDRNHPSVFLWSVGNEEPHFIREEGARILRTLKAEVRKLDSSRPIITANDRAPDICTVYDHCDLIGVNYNLHMMDMLHEKFPNKAILSTENSAHGTTRGWYENTVHSLGYVDAYDHTISHYFGARESTWKFITDRPWMMGGFQWIAFEHRGEAAWPRVCSCSGSIDLYLQRKDAFYQNKSLWDAEPVLHLFPHWNWQHRAGEPIEVWAYTNCDEVELFLNGESQGRISVTAPGHAEWWVPYTPGKIEAVGYIDGKEILRDVRETTGKAVALHLTAENAADVTANGKDVLLLTCSCVDAEGRTVPDASPEVLFFANSIGEVIATGSDNTDHVPVNSPRRRMYAGAITVAVRLGNLSGDLKVTAQSDKLDSFTLTIPIL